MKTYFFSRTGAISQGVLMPLAYFRAMHNNNGSSHTLSPRSQSIVNDFDNAYDNRDAIKDNIADACEKITHTTDLSGRAAEVGHPTFNLGNDLNNAFCALEITEHTPPDSTLDMSTENIRLLEANKPFFNALEPVLEGLSRDLDKIGANLNETNLANGETGLPTPVRELDEKQALLETSTALDNFSADLKGIVTTYAPQNVDTVSALNNLAEISEVITKVIA
jgi:hypothetical protein